MSFDIPSIYSLDANRHLHTQIPKICIQELLCITIKMLLTSNVSSRRYAFMYEKVLKIISELLRVRLAPLSMLKPSNKNTFTDRSKAMLRLWMLFVICVFLCYTVLYATGSLVSNCWEKADLLALLCAVFSCVFVTFPYGILGQVRFLIISILDLCLLPYFKTDDFFLTYLTFYFLGIFERFTPSADLLCK